MSLKERSEELCRSAKLDDVRTLKSRLRAFVVELGKQPGPIGAEMARQTVSCLRNHRRFDALLKATQAIVLDGCHDAQVYQCYAQALIETGSPTAAIGVLDCLVDRPKIDQSDRLDALGVRGRAWKDIAVGARGRRDDDARHAVRQSYKSYADGYRHNNKTHYQGINCVALAYWDEGFALSSDQRSSALEAAIKIFSTIDGTDPSQRSLWDLATAGEALVALDKLKESLSWFEAYASHPDIDSFKLAGTVRQLTEMYRLDETPDGQRLLAPLSAKTLTLPGGTLTTSRSSLQLMSEVTPEEYEKVLGETGARTHSWLQMGLRAARSVALICNQGRGIGTGFAVKGSDLHPDWGDDLLILTNSHVVSDPPEPDATAPQDAQVRFELADKDDLRRVGLDVEAVVWQSPSNAHDASVLKLAGDFSEHVDPINIDRRLPDIDGSKKHRVYVIGHPGGNEISFSFEDNELLDYDVAIYGDDAQVAPGMLHYRAPTERGSSGSPVFNGNWKAVGLHHAGSIEMRQLNGKLGTYAANEGIWIESIRRAIRAYKDL